MHSMLLARRRHPSVADLIAQTVLYTTANCDPSDPKTVTYHKNDGTALTGPNPDMNKVSRSPLR
jgi:hypothetical protein